jgi:adenylate kinase
MRIVLLGPPGAGKGTLAGAIKEKYAFAHISMGDILREEMKSNSPLGRQVKGFVESGGLVPDDIVTQIIEQKLTKSNVTQQGFLLDGFPRTETQAKDLDAILARIKKPIDTTIYLDASLPVIVQRLGGRRVCRACGALYHLTNMPPRVTGKCDSCKAELYQRPDDNEATIKTRLDVYMKNTEPIIDFYRKQNKLQRLNADKGIQELLQRFDQIVDEWKKSNSH